MPVLSELETLARQAGKILMAGFGQKHQVDYKGAIDIVTEVDRRSEAFLLEQIRDHYPNHAIVAEESGGLTGAACCTWYIDPLDGTVNYAHGVPIFSVSIAYAEGGQVQLGVVYDPVRDECFSAERGTGAWLNGAPIQPSQAQLLDHSLLVTGFPYNIRSRPDTNLDYYSLFSLRSQGVRRLGSAALDLCYVACGRLDGFWELELQSYDMAAGALIAEEGGAVVTDLDGSAWKVDSDVAILATTPAIHGEMARVLKDKS